MRRAKERLSREAHDLLMRIYDVKADRLKAKSAKIAEEPGVTVVTVNFNTLSFLRTLYRAVRRHAQDDLRIIVVDNGSSDGSTEWLRHVSKEDPYLSVVALARNLGHGRALDFGFYTARTEFVVALDVDAFPIDDAWISAVVEPLRSGAKVAGGFTNGYVHPSYLAMRRSHFLAAGHTFEASYNRHRQPLRKEFGHYDAGQLITLREPEAVQHRIMPTSVRGPKVLGTVFGDVVYHNFFSARFGAAASFSSGGNLDLLRQGAVRQQDAESAWADALLRYGLEEPDHACG